MNYRDEIRVERRRLVSRRHFFGDCAVGLGSLALASLLGDRTIAATRETNPLAPKRPHFPGRAKRVIYLFQAGGPSQLEMFDNKPGLAKYNGKPCPPELLKGQTLAFIKPDAALFSTQFKFSRHGQSGAEMSEALVHLPRVADQLTIIRSMMTDAVNHAPAQIMMQTGSVQFGRPSFGSWVTYGLGSESQDLPAFVVLSSAGGTSGGSSLWGSGFLPTVYQGVPFRRSGEPILSLASPRGVTREMQRDTLDTLKELNQHLLDKTGDAEIATRINSFEMAYRMQESAPELMDLSRETKATIELYGAEPGKNTYANNCLLARRLIERGVRFVQLYHEAWDHHGQVHKGTIAQCKETDQANTALLIDLKQRGLLDDTIVIWGGEFGRTPMIQGEPDGSNALGRDHHNRAFTMWLAGGGFKPGITHGETDEIGFNVARDPVHVHDLHATLLHLLGFNHEKLTVRFQGRDFRLTDVHGVVQEGLLG
ncbi:MAG: DUF1501 domain-containing protein [Acidobacteria bacterium]|nr:DUF1501 domain-containing protein [Acidobacteriota bacterium]